MRHPPSTAPVFATEADNICQRISTAEALRQEHKRMTDASKILTTQANLLFDAGHMKEKCSWRSTGNGRTLSVN
ncbi:hypothetical protein CEXT_811401 [Caerostris extrusa]|uniref:Uncharacterized protein n=1 Tax=Caerostris extrusa TaxID=172846 RepID=A0AAV4SHM6_CAEEX|nr:hypothetical protein CEXT_811401 [Caerostris extrusa]